MGPSPGRPLPFRAEAWGPAVDRLRRVLEGMPPAVPALVLVLVALAYRVHVAGAYGDVTFEGMVRGVPVSDGRQWDTLAMEFSTGERWDASWRDWGARRPFYYIFMGSLFSWAGHSLLVTRAANIAMGCLSVALVFDLTRRVASAPVAVLTGLSQAILLPHARFALTPMTEPLGSFLGDASMWALIMGLERLRAGRRPAWFLASGVLLSLGNLTRPLNLLACVALPPILVLVRPRTGAGSARGGRRVLAGSLALLAGVALPLVPWLIRQRAVYGIASLSDNSGEMLYAATSPASRTWSDDVSARAGAASIPERVRFYDEGIRRHLRQHLRWYLDHVVESLAATGRRLHPRRSVLLAGFALLLLSGLAAGDPRGNRRLLLGASALGAGLLLLGQDPLETSDTYGTTKDLFWFWLAGAAISILRREPAGLLAGWLLANLVLLALVAVPPQDVRFTHSLQWPATALALLCVERSLAWVRNGRPGPVPGVEGAPAVPAWGRAALPIRRAAAAAGFLLVAGLLRAVLLNLHVRPAPPVRVNGFAAQAWVARAVSEGAAPGSAPLGPLLEVRRARLRPGYSIPVRPGEDLDHWFVLFHPRPYPVTVFETRPALPELYGVFPGDLPGLPEAGDLVLVGLRRRIPLGERSQTEVFEVIAAARPETGAWIRPAPGVASAHARYLGGPGGAGAAGGP